MMEAAKDEFSISSIRKAVQGCCRTSQECGPCQGKNCLVGFAKIVSDYAGLKKTLNIPNGIKMVPSADFKTYTPEDVAMAIAVINTECKNCMDSHEDNCVINVTRSALEVCLFGQHFSFQGNPLMYMMKLSEVDSQHGAMVMNAYRSLKK